MALYSRHFLDVQWKKKQGPTSSMFGSHTEMAQFLRAKFIGISLTIIADISRLRCFLRLSLNIQEIPRVIAFFDLPFSVVSSFNWPYSVAFRPFSVDWPAELIIVPFVAVHLPPVLVMTFVEQFLFTSFSPDYSKKSTLATQKILYRSLRQRKFHLKAVCSENNHVAVKWNSVHINTYRTLCSIFWISDVDLFQCV